MFSLFRKKNGIPFVLLTIFAAVFQYEILAASTPLPYNPGDQDGVFRFAIPLRYHNATLGPETFDWLVRIYGRSSVIRSNIRRAPSDSHICGNGGWCRLHCRRSENLDWTRKDMCGAYNCCLPKERQRTSDVGSTRKDGIQSMK